MMIGTHFPTLPEAPGSRVWGFAFQKEDRAWAFSESRVYYYHYYHYKLLLEGLTRGGLVLSSKRACFRQLLYDLDGFHIWEDIQILVSLLDMEIQG